MNPAFAHTPTSTYVFEDGLGRRHHAADAGNQPLEVLTLREELTAVPSFEFALRERASRLAGFRHASYGQVRGIDKTGNTLAVVSDRVEGVRLSQLLGVAEQQLLPVEIDAALCVIRQLVQALAMLHEQVPDVCHGAIALERVVITPNARAVVVEHVLGAALGQLLYPRERYWKDLRIAMPPRAGAPRFDRRADVTQLGAVSLALILGRPLAIDDYPARIAEIVERVGAVSASGGLEPLHEGVRSWLARALQLDSRNSFASAVEARADFDAVLRDADYAAAPSALESLLAQYQACLPGEAEPSGAAPAPAVQPVPAPQPPAASPHKSASAAAALTVPEIAAHDAPPTPAPPVGDTGSGVHRIAAPIPATETRSAANEHAPRVPPAGPRPKRTWMIAAVALLAVTSGGALAARHYLLSDAAAEMGTLVVNTNPEGVPVFIDGKARGTTPLTASIAPGDHVVELVLSDSERRSMPVKITPGGQVTQFLELPKLGPAHGTLQVHSDPAGARVSVDGQVHGRAPVIVDGLAPGEHVVMLENDLGSVKQTVVIEAGTTASLVVPLGAAPRGSPLSGWIAVNVPADVQIYEDGRLLGSSRSERIMVPVGRRQLELVNESLGYRATHVVQVTPGQVATVRPDWPKGTLAINALPWADVFIDGRPVGETPIGNIVVPVGPHQVTFRHPELGEHQTTTIVTYGTPTRVSVDLRKR